MTEEVKTEDESRRNFEIEAARWHFWFIVSFSLFLIITFIFYLPLQFRHQVTTGGHDEAMDTHMEDMPGGDMHGGHGAVAHEEADIKDGLVVNFTATPAIPAAGATTTLEFFVNLKPKIIPVPAVELEIEHEKLMHVIGVRSDMNEFFHIHPGITTKPGVFAVEYAFTKPGRYKIWSEIKKDGVTHAFGHPELTISGEGQSPNKQVSFERHVVVGDYQVFLQHGAIVKGVPSHLSFDVHDVFAEDVVLENYLGAKMHLAIIKDDLTQFIHTHPEDGHDDAAMDHHASWRIISEVYAHTEDGVAPVPSTHEESIEFTAVFPEAGLYKVFAQFHPLGSDIRQDEALTAEFWIEVKDKAPGAVSPWWMLLIVSAVAIVILSKGVSGYLGEEK